MSQLIDTSMAMAKMRLSDSEERGPSHLHGVADNNNDGDLLSNILAPGSSLHPSFLLVVDVVLALLSLTLGSLAIATGGNVHLIALLCG